MIAVIADDITGAAEIAGIGLRYGLKVLLSEEVATTEKIDLLVIYTNTRPLPEAEAIRVMSDRTEKIAKLKPSLFYKKTDSVLRGHVLAEMKAQMQAFRFTKALLLPANPLLGRIIKNGHYYINGRPVHEAGFSNDPEFPIRSSSIEEMLGANSEVQVASFVDQLSDGITVGQASSMKEVKDWASLNENNIFYAGAASFFAELLHQRFVRKKVQSFFQLGSPLLLVSGTSYGPRVDKLKQYSELVSVMPDTLFMDDSRDENAQEKWANEIAEIIRKKSRCIMTVGQREASNLDPAALRQTMSATVKNVLQNTTVVELLIEGGSTAYSVIQALGFTAFEPTEELQQGIVRMKVMGVDNLNLTIKPGSYAWPEQWEQAFE